MSDGWTQEWLEERLAHWQKVLRLQDWDVKVAVVRRAQMMLKGSEGECHWVQTMKSALIKLQDPAECPSDPRWERDMERTLVHELLHLHFAPFYRGDKDTDDPERIAQETAIEQISKGLVRLERKQGQNGIS